MKTILTIEDSQRLIELGVDPKLASRRKTEYDENVVPRSYPIFTLTDILNILPKGIVHKGLWIKFRITTWIDEPWFAGYQNQIGEYVTPNHAPFSAPELIDALYQLLIWVIENGYIYLKEK